MVTAIRGEHNHDTDLTKVMVGNVVKEEVATASKNLNVSLRAVMANITSKLQNANQSQAVYVLPKMSTISKQVQRAREREFQMPQVPRSWDELKVPEAMSVTCSDDPFLIMEEEIEDHRPEKILCFASQEGIRLMKSATQFFIDGNFEVVEATLFEQLLIVTSTTPAGVRVPTAWFFLPTKEPIGYSKALKCLKNGFGIPDPSLIHCDFEHAIIKAVKSIFPLSEILCCDAHFKRALRRNLSAHHLIAAYNCDADLQQFVRYIWALSLVPIKDIKEVWNKFVSPFTEVFEDVEWDNVEPRDLEAYFTYLERTWIGGTNPRTGKECRPMFQHELWNKHQAVLEDQDRTTNSAEGYNHQLKNAVPKGANLWTVINYLQKEESLVAVKVRDGIITDQDSPRSGRDKERQVRNRELKKLVENYGKISLKVWMDSIVGYYS